MSYSNGSHPLLLFHTVLFLFLFRTLKLHYLASADLILNSLRLSEGELRVKGSSDRSFCTSLEHWADSALLLLLLPQFFVVSATPYTIPIP